MVGINGDKKKFFFQFANEKKWRQAQLYFENGNFELKILLKPEDIMFLNSTNLDKNNMCIMLQTHQTKFMVGGGNGLIYELHNNLINNLPQNNISNPGTKFAFDEFRILKSIVEKKNMDYMKNILLYNEEYFNKIIERFKIGGYINDKLEITKKGLQQIKEYEMERDILLVISNGNIQPEKISVITEIPTEELFRILDKLKSRGILKETNELTSFGKKILQIFSTVF